MDPQPSLLSMPPEISDMIYSNIVQSPILEFDEKHLNDPLGPISLGLEDEDLNDTLFSLLSTHDIIFEQIMTNFVSHASFVCKSPGALFMLARKSTWNCFGWPNTAYRAVLSNKKELTIEFQGRDFDIEAESDTNDTTSMPDIVRFIQTYLPKLQKLCLSAEHMSDFFEIHHVPHQEVVSPLCRLTDLREIVFETRAQAELEIHCNRCNILCTSRTHHILHVLGKALKPNWNGDMSDKQRQLHEEQMLKDARVCARYVTARIATLLKPRLKLASLTHYHLWDDLDIADGSVPDRPKCVDTCVIFKRAFDGHKHRV